jgi:cell division protein FtsI/penicillin-binding protein 2
MFSPRRSSKRRLQRVSSLSSKANRVLNIILIAFVVVVVRLWHLTVVQHDVRQQQAQRPQRRMVVEPAKRGTIRDRFNIPLAVNRIQYNAAVLYAPLRQIPAVRWECDDQGKKVKCFKRRDYIRNLSNLLGQLLSLPPERVEDLIHSKAALYNQMPFMIKEDITEQEYYALKVLELQWPGIQAQRLSRRYYPQGRVACDIVGYMGAINRQEYERLIGEIAALQDLADSYERDEAIALPAECADIADLHAKIRALKGKCYTLTDAVGKSGIEAHCERELRGLSGKKNYYSDAQGNFLKELPGAQPPQPGQRLLLTISAELQAYAERLLIQNEQIRETRATVLDGTQKRFLALKTPWIKGGAIVAIDPRNGDLLAMASHPRYDPNDFILTGNIELNQLKRSNMRRWLESEVHIAEIWDQQCPFQRENYDPKSDSCGDTGEMMTWQLYLQRLLADKHPVSIMLLKDINLAAAVQIGAAAEVLLTISGQPSGLRLINALYCDAADCQYGKSELPSHELKLHLQSVSTELQPHIELLAPFMRKLPSNYDKVLLIDLCRLVAHGGDLPRALVQEIGSLSLSEYRQLTAAVVAIRQVVHEICSQHYRSSDFALWRQQNEKSFLQAKRAEEKAAGVYAKPYIDLLDKQEGQLFAAFWEQHQGHLMQIFLLGESAEGAIRELSGYEQLLTTWHQEISHGGYSQLSWHAAHSTLGKFLATVPPALRCGFVSSARSFAQLTRPLFGSYPALMRQKESQLEKHLAAGFYPKYGFGYGRSYAYRQAATQGSIFKMVTAHEALVQKYQALGGCCTAPELNPLEIVDTTFTKGKELYVGYHADGKPIPRFYKGGRLLRSVTRHAGPMDIVKAIEISSNPYFSLLAGDVLHAPNDLARAARQFSYGQRTGVDLPWELAGRVPEDLEKNRTGLYATAIGQHTLVVTPLQSSVMLSALANGGKILKPKIVGCRIGYEGESLDGPLHRSDHFPFQAELEAVGIDFSPFVALAPRQQESCVRKTPTIVRQLVVMPDIVRAILLEGMYKVAAKAYESGLFGLSRLYSQYPEAISDYIDLKGQLLGKTSTAESNERIDISEKEGINMYNHVWFGGIAFNRDLLGRDKMLFVSHDIYGEPELVVVVYLRLGGFGKEAAPIAAQIVAKWREINQRHRQ